MKEKILGSLALATLIAFAGCSGGSSGPLPMEKACSEYEKAICDLLDRCELSIMFEVENHASCLDSFDLCDGEFQRLIESANAGRVRYDGNQARTCLDRVKSLTCAELPVIFDNELAECEIVFSGLVGADGDCYYDKECAQGHYCSASRSTCPGKCLPFAQTGSSCVDAACDPKQAECQNNICVPLAKAGEPCENISCLDGLECDSSTDPARCVLPGAEGSGCASNDQCQPGLRCLQQKCTGPAKASETCVFEEFEEFFMACETGYYCDADILHQQHQGACQPKKGQGESCILFYECKPEFYCIGITVSPGGQLTPGRCQPPVTEGGTCNASLGEGYIPECRYDLWCNPQTQKCETLPGEGGVCTDDDMPPCKNDDLYCETSSGTKVGVCRAKKADNQPCQDDEECLSDRCELDVCTPKYPCTPQP